MLILAVLSLAVLADGYYFNNRPTLPMGNNLLVEMCVENGVKLTDIEEGGLKYIECLDNLFGAEIDMAQNNGSYDKVIKENCAKAPQLKKCIFILFDYVISPCVPAKDQQIITSAKTVTDQFLHYICNNDGGIITRFITTDGPTCLRNKSSDMEICVKDKSFARMKPAEIISLVNSKPYALYDDLVNCVAQKLETCDSQAPSEIFRGAAKIFREGFIEQKSAAVSGMTTASGLIGLLLFVAVYI